MNQSDAQIDHDEDEIVGRFSRIVREGSSEQQVTEINTALEAIGSGIRLTLLDKVNSIAVYVVCQTFETLCRLDQVYMETNEQLRVVLEDILTLLLENRRRVGISKLTWRVTNFNRCLRYFYICSGKYRGQYNYSSLRLWLGLILHKYWH